tara:strand:- start:303 stop:770 length:468 start_codon:yes stop_codon:yes gene_type:complete
MERLQVIPITLKEANLFVENFHRHNKKVQGARFCLGASYDDKLVGVIIIGRPVARKLDDGFTAEVTRSCVLDHAPKNTNSFLYGRGWRVWNQMGGKRMITYTLQEESGSTMKAVGWKMIGETGGWDKGKGWTTRPGREWQPITGQLKFRWEKKAN